MDVAIVGGGHNGLVAAAYLAKAGLDVHVFERRPFVGGAAITEELWPGFKFSTCAHMTHGIHPKIVRDLKLYERGMEAIPRKAGIQMRGDGGFFGPRDHDSPNNLTAEGKMTEEELEGERRYNAFKRTLREIFAPYRLRVPPTLEEVRAKVAGTSAADILEKALETPILELQDEYLPSGMLKDRYCTELGPNGRNPMAISSAYYSLNEPEEETGEKPPRDYVLGGIGVISRCMAEAAEEAGATLQVDAGVDGFLVEDGKVIGLKMSDGSEVRARAVASNLDPKRTFLKLLPPEHLDGGMRSRIEGLITNVSCYKFLAVISELPKWKDWDGDLERPGQGTVGLERRRETVAAAYDDLEAGRPPKAPIMNFSIPSVLDPSLTQPGYHTASVWIYPAPGKLAEGT